jgi:hypothetical protein
MTGSITTKGAVDTAKELKGKIVRLNTDDPPGRGISLPRYG